ncbi:formin-like protein 8 [Tripterygium wilfordii]|uniref:Formin-like protein n=1 Tax=Tripterygium wilfordii TaxID=458696 RepID=A0A7J7CL36_TRIWF|nr:formin-like protein 8 [Tripterygium wilfordii]KAF5734731.1 formin-like protein 8 [Tripterygium wilfordii]
MDIMVRLRPRFCSYLLFLLIFCLPVLSFSSGHKRPSKGIINNSTISPNSYPSIAPALTPAPSSIDPISIPPHFDLSIAPVHATASNPPPSSTRKVVKAVAATAAVCLFLAGIAFVFFYLIFTRRRQKNDINTGHQRGEDAMVAPKEFQVNANNVRGLVMDEDGQNVLYMKKSEDGQLRVTFRKMRFNPSYGEEMEEGGGGGGGAKEMDASRGLLEKSKRTRRSFNHKSSYTIDSKKVKESVTKNPTLSHEIESSVTPKPAQPSNLPKVIPMNQIPLPPPPPPPREKKVAVPPPSPSPPQPPAPPPPPPPPPPPRTSHLPPPPPLPPSKTLETKNSIRPPRAGGMNLPVKTPSAPKGKANNKSAELASTEKGLKGTGHDQMKLKPLHWDKVKVDADHSLVWDQINDGSLRVDDDQMQALFGYTTSGKPPDGNKAGSSSGSSNPVPSAKVFILEPRKSQNTAIVIKSLENSCKEILDALLEGQGLTVETLEKLAKISPTKEEAAKIMQFSGNPAKLADAESFLYRILNPIPSAFIRINAMLFRSNYEPEILHHKESLQILEMGCKELRAHGLFFKLLEAILKAGNRMNAGTSRGNAQGFILSALRNLSDIKSTDGKTTLLQFVVEQVARSEGRRCMANQNHIFGRPGSEQSKSRELNLERKTAEETDKEYLVLGLSEVGALRTKFSNVRKAATIEYNSFINTCNSLTTHVAENQMLVKQCANGERGGFLREMKGFLEECEEEIKVVKEEQTMVMEHVKRTTDYYQAGTSKDIGEHPLQLFVNVKDFLDMVDRACTDISQKLQKKSRTVSTGSSITLTPNKITTTMTPVRFPDSRLLLMSDMSGSSFSESDFDF